MQLKASHNAQSDLKIARKQCGTARMHAHCHDPILTCSYLITTTAYLEPVRWPALVVNISPRMRSLTICSCLQCQPSHHSSSIHLMSMLPFLLRLDLDPLFDLWPESWISSNSDWRTIEATRCTIKIAIAATQPANC